MLSLFRRHIVSTFEYVGAHLQIDTVLFAILCLVSGKDTVKGTGVRARESRAEVPLARVMI